MRPITLRALLILTLTSGALDTAFAQSDRRDRQFPELILETGGRTGTCDALQFTPDGKHLFAVGDDKAVRFWNVGAASLEPGNVLRWPAWREQRGAIYTVALSPDGSRVAVGGMGLRSGTVMILDRETGEVKASLAKPLDDQVNRAIVFTEDGRGVVFGSEAGNVWLWEPGKDARKLASFEKLSGREFNRVRLLAWVKGRLLAGAENGQVLDLDPTGRRAPEEVLHLKPASRVRFYRMALSPDQKWLAAAPTNAAYVAIRSLDRLEKPRDIQLEVGEHPRSIAFDPKGNRLAVGVGRAPLTKDGFLVPANDRVTVCALDESPPWSVAHFSAGYHAEAIAFHPDGNRLAVAGGPDHDVTLWDVSRLKSPLANAVGSGRCLWEVGLSKDDNLLGFRDQRATAPTGPNARGAGPWQVFSLEDVGMSPEAKFEPAPRRESGGGWTVAPDRDDPYVWYAVAPDGKRHALPLDPGRDQMPQCYTFLEGKTPRLVVGHYWGLSVYELKPDRVRRSRLCTGHQSQVTSVAASAKGDWLVSASRDQTIAAWSLDPWKHQAELGASFDEVGDRLVVQAMDPDGGAAREAGLVVGEEVLTLAAGGKLVYNREAFRLLGKNFPPSGRVKDALDALAQPEPGAELYFRVKQGAEIVERKTTLRQRPLWRLLPARKNEWVLWMWQHPYYASSTNGDSLVRWLVNDADLDRTPTSYPLEQFRGHFESLNVIGNLLASRSIAKSLPPDHAPVSFDNLDSEALKLTADATEVKDTDVKLTLRARPRGDNPDQAPRRVELWLNDYRLQVWDAGGRPFEKPFTVERNLFRFGANELTMQVYTRNAHGKEIRAEVSLKINANRPIGLRKLHGLFVGVTDYGKARLLDGTAPPNLRFAGFDANALRVSWAKQNSTGLFAPGELIVLTQGGKGDGSPERAEILSALDRLARECGPNDLVVLFLSGHGDLKEAETDFQSFVFCPPDFQQKRPADTGVTSRLLADRLAKIKGHKIVLLDTCHSGGILNPVRALTPGGRGPSILASCDRNQRSYEDPFFEHGLFTQALLEALEGKAELGAGKTITTRMVRDWLGRRVPELVRKLDRNLAQTPIGFPSELEDLPLARPPRPVDGGDEKKEK